MKSGIHPDYQIANVHCSCGNTFQTRSTVSQIRAELCSNCHPFSEDEEQVSSKSMGISLAVALVLFVAIFVAGPALLFGWIQHRVGSGLLVNVLEGLFRVALFIAYLLAIGRTKEIHRVFEYHGAEHKTI